MKDRRKARHTHPIPDPDVHPVKYRLLQLRWRMAVAAVVYPVQVALAVALAVCSIPVYLVLDQQATLKSQAQVQTRQQAQIKHLLDRIQTNRVKVAREICGQLDRNARTVNAQLTLYQKIIVGGARSSRIFDRLYRQYGAPPYRVRVRQAEAAAKRIDALRLPLPNCDSTITSLGVIATPPPHGNP